MAKSAGQKLKLLYLKEILTQRTDDSHGLTVEEMISALAAQGISAERKSIYDDLEALRQYGLDIESSRGKRHIYYVANREFQLPELKLLVDAVQSFKFLTYKKSAELIKKIEGLASVHEAGKLQRQVYISNRSKAMNESIYYNVDKLHTAIHENRKVSFRYFSWVLDKTAPRRFSRQYRREGKRYLLSPFALTWDDTNYYLIAYDHLEEKIKHFRVDKMMDIQVEEEKRDGQEQFSRFDIGAYSKSVFGMFGGEEELVRLRMHHSLIGVIVDRFGEDVFISLPDEEHFEISLPVKISPQFWSWMFGLGEKARILAPPKAVQEYQAQLKRVLEAQESL